MLIREPSLEKVAGTEGQMVFWSGASADAPDYSWTFVGTDLSGDAEAYEFDPAITVSKLGTGDVANIMKRAKDGLVLDFAHEGALPGMASIYVKASELFADGADVGLYCYNTEAKRFERAQAEVKVEGGYASFAIDHCSTWALSSDDLSAYAVEETNTPRAIKQADTIAVNAEEGQGIDPMLIIGAAALIAAAAVVVAVVVVRRKKALGESAEDVEDVLGKASDEPNESAGNAAVSNEVARESCKDGDGDDARK